MPLDVRPTNIRVALYYAPAPSDPLHAAASSWLGRDAETDAPRPQPDLPGIAELTADPRGYGFHATLKPPMRLRDGATWDDVTEAAEAIASAVAPFDLPALAVSNVKGFLALREMTPSPELQAFSDLCVASADHLRAPPSDEELARRRKAPLGVAHEAMLTRWGYPYVFATWFFHMTLTRRLSDAERATVLPSAEAHFADAVAVARRVTDLAVFTQRAPGTGFVIAERFPLRG